MKPRRSAITALVLALAGTASVGHGAWITAKAEVAQILLERAWSRARGGEEQARPWTWADTWPVARLTAPAHGVSRIVLAGSSGAVMAFGPGHLDGSARPGAAGNVVLSGHRDTHFEFLRDLSPGDELRLETPDGEEQIYRVDRAEIVDEHDVASIQPTTDDVLTLVTCYPFDDWVPGGPLRYVVRAVRPSSSEGLSSKIGVSLPLI